MLKTVNETIEARRKLEEKATNAGVTTASQSKLGSSAVDGIANVDEDKLDVEEQGSPSESSESSESSQTIAAEVDACIAKCLDEVGQGPDTSVYNSD